MRGEGLGKLKTGRLYWISYIVLVCFTFETAVFTAEQWLPNAVRGLFSLRVHAVEKPAQKPAIMDRELHHAAELAFGNPLWKPHELESLAQPFQLKHDDPILDQDPFFLRTQTWTQVPSSQHEDRSENDGPSFHRTANSVEVLLPGMQRAWVLNVPLEPLLATDDYLFFSAADPSIFEEKAGDGEIDSELGGGVFVVAYDDLLDALPDSKPVPVFFFPLYGDAWDVDVRAHEEPALSAIHFVDAGDEIVTVKTDDIDRVILVERGNLALARLDATKGKIFDLKKNPGFVKSFRDLVAGETKSQEEVFGRLNEIGSLLGDEEIFPGRGSTAGFGVLYAGFDLDRGSSSPMTMSAFGQTSSHPLNKLFDLLGPGLAFASDPDDPATVMKHAYDTWRWLFAILGVLAIFAVTSRYLIKPIRVRLREINDLHDKNEIEKAEKAVKERLEKIEKKRQKTGRTPQFGVLWHKFLTWKQKPKHRGVRYHMRREARAIFNNFGYTITAFDQLRTLPFGALVGYGADRYLTRFMSANKPMRKLMDKTFLYSKEVNSGAVVNGQIIAKGLLIGGIDVGGYAAQLIWLYPKVAAEIADGLKDVAPGVSEAFRETFVESNPRTARIANTDIQSTAQDNIMKLSAHYTTPNDFNTQLNTARVHDKMIHEGLNPEDPRNAAERKKRMDEAVDQANRKVGLPGRNEFVWDLTSVLGTTKSFLGFKIGSDEKKYEQVFLGEFHPGFIFPALKAAEKYAAEELKRDSSNAQAREGLSLFRELIDDLGVIRNLVDSVNFRENFIREAPRFRKVRQTLILLTAEGENIGPLLEVLEGWSKRISMGSAAWAANVFTSKFLEKVSGKQIRLLPTTAEREKYGHEAEKKALVDLQALFTEDHVNGANLKEKHKATFEVFRDRHVLNFAFAAERAETYRNKPYKYENLGWFGRWQKRRAERRTHIRFVQLYNRSYGADTLMSLPAKEREAERRRWDDIYANEYARAAGLVPDFPPSEMEIREKAEKRAKRKFKNIAGRTFRPGTDEKDGLWKDIYQQAYIAERDSIPDYESRARLRDHVTKKADFLAAHEEDRNEPLKIELQRLLDEKRYEEYEKLRATQYAQSFIRAYEDSTENAHWEDVAPMSPARPGRWQKFRQRKIVRHANPLSKTMTVTCRVLEATTNPTHRLGLNALLDRRMWGYYGFKFSTINTLRHFPMNATSGYWFRDKMLKTSLPRKVWVWYHMVTGVMFRMGHAFSYRLSQNLGIKPMGRLSHVLFFSGAYVLFTGWGSLLATPSSKWFETSVWKHLENWWNVATYPFSWTKRKVSCDIFDSCEDVPIIPKSDAEKVYDTVKEPVFSDGEGSTDMNRMWDPEMPEVIDMAEEWLPIDAAPAYSN